MVRKGRVKAERYMEDKATIWLITLVWFLPFEIDSAFFFHLGKGMK